MYYLSTIKLYILKKKMNIKAILNNWQTADRLVAGLRLIYRPKRSENTPGWHHARSCHFEKNIKYV